MLVGLAMQHNRLTPGSTATMDYPKRKKQFIEFQIKICSTQ